jgi:hypothetical protein
LGADGYPFSKLATGYWPLALGSFKIKEHFQPPLKLPEANSQKPGAKTIDYDESSFQQ